MIVLMFVSRRHLFSSSIFSSILSLLWFIQPFLSADRANRLLNALLGTHTTKRSIAARQLPF